MPQISEYNSVVDDIVQEVQKLSIIKQQQILIKIRLSNYLRRDKKPIIKYNKKKIKAPTLEQIDEWKHESIKKK